MSYLEIGVDQGDCFNKVRCEKKVGVDPYVGSGDSREGATREEWKEAIGDEYRRGPATHIMTSDLFFEQNTDAFDIMFIDGLHEADQVEKDINNAIDCMSFNNDGIIVVHDCLPLTEAAQQVPRGDVWGWNGDAWKAIVKLRYTLGCEYSNISVRTVDTDQGCAIIGSGFEDILVPTFEECSWEHFDTNRAKLMNIITVPEFLRIA